MGSWRTWWERRTGAEPRLAALALLWLGAVAATGPSSATAEESAEAGAESRAEWRPFSPPGGDFRIELPGAPALRRDDRFTPGGSVRETKYHLHAEGVELAVETHVLPPLATFVMSDDALLDRARDGVIAHDGGETIDSEDVVVQGAPARAFTWRYPGEPARLERSLTVLVGSRLYLLTGTGSDPASHPAVSRFFDSFRLLEAGETRE